MQLEWEGGREGGIRKMSIKNTNDAEGTHIIAVSFGKRAAAELDDVLAGDDVIGGFLGEGGNVDGGPGEGEEDGKGAEEKEERCGRSNLSRHDGERFGGKEWNGEKQGTRRCRRRVSERAFLRSSG